MATTPHVGAPHFAAPHVAGPRMAPHTAPHLAPHTAPQHGVSRFAGEHHQAPSLAHPNARHGLAANPTSRPGAHPNERGARRNALAPANQPHAGAVVGNAPNEGRGRRNAPATVGQGAAGAAHAAVTGPGHRPNGRGNRVLSNPVLTSMSPRDPAARSLARSRFRGQFAQSGWARDFDRRHHHHRHFGLVLGFVGPSFWPYAYDDFVDYTFWPAAYDEFWPYAYDDVFEGMFGGYSPEYSADYSGPGATSSSSRAGGRVASRGPVGETAGPMICSGDAQGLTDFPIQRIAQQVQPDQNQQALLDQLKSATEKAVQILQAACPTDLPATPTGRLAAMRIRVQAMLQAVQVVRPALDKFYGSLNDEQKERFNALDQAQEAVNVATTGKGGTGRQQDVSQACDSRAPSPAGMPIDRIRGSLHLSDAQNANLQRLDDASSKAAEILKASCSTGQPLTPPGRIAAMEQRLQGMLQAIDTVQPALAQFYGSLSDEQKARFDRLGARPA